MSIIPVDQSWLLSWSLRSGFAGNVHANHATQVTSALYRVPPTKHDYVAREIRSEIVIYGKQLQRKLTAFRTEYNEVRPHQALDNRTPSRVHRLSPRPYPSKIREWEYPKEMAVRYVSRNAAIRWKSTKWVMVSTTLAGKHVGLEELGNGIWRVFFRSKLLGYLDERTLRIEDVIGRIKRNNV